MGCNIHPHIEYKEQGAQTWQHWASFYFGRNYLLFSLMANVHNRFTDGIVDPVAMPRGTPEDAAWETKRACKDYGSDGHSHSWLTLDELKEVERRFKALTEYPFPATVQAALVAMDSLQQAEMSVQVRLVFWFDN